jgi:hypothetical protein
MQEQWYGLVGAFTTLLARSFLDCGKVGHGNEMGKKEADGDGDGLTHGSLL